MAECQRAPVGQVQKENRAEWAAEGAWSKAAWSSLGGVSCGPIQSHVRAGRSPLSVENPHLKALLSEGLRM